MRRKIVPILFIISVSILIPIKESKAWYLFWRDGTCKVTGLSCNTTVERDLDKNCCVYPVNNTTCEKNNSCRGVLFLHWKKGSFPIKWYTNINKIAGFYSFSLFSPTTILNTFKKAWEKWSQIKCAAVTHRYAGTTTDKAVAGDKKNVFYIPTPDEWAKLGVNFVLAFTLFIPKRNGELDEADILFNPSINNGTYLWADKTNLQKNRFGLLSVTLHELGHLLGLAHNTEKESIMDISNSKDKYLATQPKSDDIKGICWLYPAKNSCTSDNQCAKCYSCQNGICSPLPPPSPKTCLPCRTDTDCGKNSICLKTPDGNRCFQLCAQNKNESCCPRQYSCKEIDGKKVCIPNKSHCPLKKCKTNSECGLGICRTTSGYCAAPIPFDYSRCSVSCRNSAQCGNPLFKCISIQGGRKRCMMPCFKGGLCPYGYTCKKTLQGSFCIPTDELCPCIVDSDCKSGLICKDNICQRERGFLQFEACGGLACANGLICVNLANYDQCVKKCDSSKANNCEFPTRCYYTYLGNICLGEYTLPLGAKCSIKKNCAPGLSCFYSSPYSEGLCIQRCKVGQKCKYGGICGGNPLFPTRCSCSVDSDCSRGNYCTKIANGFKTCLPCKNPPCRDNQKAVCGDGICQKSRGENCSSCPNDCACSPDEICLNGTCQRNKCKPPYTLCRELVTDREICVNLKRDPNHCGKCNLRCKECIDGRCTNRCPGGQIVCYDVNGTALCVDIKVDINHCGKCRNRCPSGHICHRGKCIPPPICGNGKCDPGEDCSICPKDCPCAPGQICNNGVCIAGNLGEETFRESETLRDSGVIDNISPRCGNGVCELQWGENCSSCPNDCACPTGSECYEGYCIKSQLLCPKEVQKKKCDPEGKHCITICPSGCSCALANPTFPAIWLLLLLSSLLSASIARKKRRKRSDNLT